MLKSHAHFPNLFADKLAGITGIDPEAYNDRYFENEVRAYANLRAIRLHANPMTGNFDLPHLCRIHTYLFEGVSSYAGSVRRYGMKGHNLIFATPAQIDQIFADKLPRLLDTLEKNKTLSGKVHTLARIANELNFAHPFREGNGRSLRIYLEQLANRQGLTLDLGHFVVQDQTRWNEACTNALQNNPVPLIQIFRELTVWQESANVLALHRAHLDAKGMSGAVIDAQHQALKKTLQGMCKEDVQVFAAQLYAQLDRQNAVQECRTSHAAVVR